MHPATYNLADTMLGKKVRCKKCGQPFLVEPDSGPGRPAGPRAGGQGIQAAGPRPPSPPRRSRAEEEDYPGQGDDEAFESTRPSSRPAGREEVNRGPARRRGRPAKKSGSSLVLWLSLGGVLLLAGVGVGLWLILGSGGSKNNQGQGGEVSTIPLEGQANQVKAVLFSDPSAHQVVVGSLDMGKNPVLVAFDRYDLKTGKKLSRTEIPNQFFLNNLALSPDGSRLLIQTDIFGNIGIWSLEDGKQIVDKFRPVGPVLKRLFRE